MSEENQWDTMPWVEDRLTELGIPPAREPEYECPVIMPGTLATIRNEEYTSTYEKILGWYGYLTEKTAYAKSMVLQSKNEMTYIELTLKQVLLEQKPKPSKDKIEIRIAEDPRYAQLQLICQKWEQLRDMLQARLETVEANLKTVSRQIEIRKLEQERGRTQNNMPYRGRP